MNKPSTLLFVAALALGLTGCSGQPSLHGAESPNCSSLNDPYFSYVATSDKQADPRGYFDEVVAEQQAYLGRLQALTPVDDDEQRLLGDIIARNEELLAFYVDEQQKRVPGETALQFWEGMSSAERADWQAIEPVLRSKTQEMMDSLDAYATYCGVGK